MSKRINVSTKDGLERARLLWYNFTYENNKNTPNYRKLFYAYDIARY